MIRRALFFLVTALLLALPAFAQDGLNLPADLYVLANNGQIQRYGVGATGVTNLTPDGVFIVDFGVDSVGERVAFRTESGLFVINVAGGGEPQQLEGASADVPPYRGSGETMAWSPNGDALAYTTTYGARVYFAGDGAPSFADLREGVFKGLSWSPGGRFLAAEADGSVWWIYRRDGNTLALTSVIPSSIGTAWVSDSEIVFAPADGGLRLMNLDQANAQAVLLDEAVIYRLPTLNAGDALVFFGRDPNDANVPEGYGRLLRLGRGASQLETIGQVPISLSGLRWAPGGSLLVAFQGGVIALYDPSTGTGFPLPLENVVAYAWGPLPNALPSVEAPQAAPTDAPAQPTAPVIESSPTLPPTPELATIAAPPTPAPVSTVTSINLPADSFFLAADARGIVQVWRMRAGGTPPQAFTGSGSDVSEFAAAPDGNTVAYTVDAELWLQGAGQPKLLARLNSFAPVDADFSADSTTIAYVDERSGVWLDVLAEDAPQLIRANGTETYRRPQFSPDGTRLLLDVYATNGVASGVLDLTTRDLRTTVPIANDPRPAQTRWLRDGRLYTYLDATTPANLAPGFYLIDSSTLEVSTAPTIPLPPNTTVRATIEAVPGSLRALLADGTEAFAPLHVVDFDLTTGAPTPIFDIGALIAPRLSPDGRFVGGYDSLTQIDGIQQGAITVVDLTTGRRFQLTEPASTWSFRWAN